MNWRLLVLCGLAVVFAGALLRPLLDGGEEVPPEPVFPVARETVDEVGWFTEPDWTLEPGGRDPFEPTIGRGGGAEVVPGGDANEIVSSESEIDSAPASPSDRSAPAASEPDEVLVAPSGGVDIPELGDEDNGDEPPAPPRD